MASKTAELSERLQRPLNRLMTAEEVEFLRDAQAAIELAIRNGMTFASIVANLSYDFNQVAHALFDLEEACRQGFKPKVSGFSRYLSEDLNGIEEQLG